MLLLIGAVALIYKPPPCRQPCKDLGDKFDPETAGELTPTYLPQCNPLGLSLELEKPTAKTGTHFTLWYRAKLKNTCCQKVEARLGFFLYGSDRFDDVRFKIWGPDGKLIEPDVWFPYDSDVLPYKVDSNANPRLLKGTDDETYTMLPGEEIPTNPAVLSPSFYNRPGHGIDAMTEEYPEPEYRATFEKLTRKRDNRLQREVEKMHPRKPPPGFRVLDRFEFKKPGKYKIQASFTAHVFVYLPSPWRDSLPKFFSTALEIFMGWTGDSSVYALPKIYDVSAESAILDFEVTR